jgi:glyoxylase-like metal-dependent hydrolase (beta-lactamase superfamily II)
MTLDKISLGKFTIHGVRDGLFYLDGGAMFGVVPKTLWEKKCPSDSQNRIKLALDSLLIQTEDSLVLVDTGIGPLLKEKYFNFYSIERKPGLVKTLQEIGFNPEDINFVINTHLHFDHCGGNTKKGESGDIVPTFPNALYFIQKGEWDHAGNPSARDRVSYLKENFIPLERHGVVQLIDSDVEITKGVSTMLAPGHTSDHQCVKVQSEGQILVFLGDLVPTSAHVGMAYIMSYDLFPMQTLETKEKFYEMALEEDWIVAFNHDPEYFFGKIEKKKNRYMFRPYGRNA